MLTQDTDPQFEAFLKAGAARVVVPVRPGFEAALAHYQETGDVWMGEEMPDMFGDNYLSIIDEIKAANFAPGKEVLRRAVGGDAAHDPGDAQGGCHPADVDTHAVQSSPSSHSARVRSARGDATARDLVLRDAAAPPQP